mmetsp:Transcript_47156/g.121865  ORF Transcript_47156/g.121865 Transcript_47156/m.121865 type:complete len:82 (+) Transcript_47156:265-510(+)
MYSYIQNNTGWTATEWDKQREERRKDKGQRTKEELKRAEIKGRGEERPKKDDMKVEKSQELDMNMQDKHGNPAVTRQASPI